MCEAFYLKIAKVLKMFYKLHFKPEMRDYLHQTHFLTTKYETFAYPIGGQLDVDCKL